MSSQGHTQKVLTTLLLDQLNLRDDTRWQDPGQSEDQHESMTGTNQ